MTTTAIHLLLPIIQELNGPQSWVKFQSGLKDLFLAVKLPGIISGSKPSDAAALKAWEELDAQMYPWVKFKTSEQYHFLIDNLESAEAAYKALKAHFQSSTMLHRITAREELYAIRHNPSHPIELYIQSLTAACTKLKGLDVTVDDNELKDLLLMRLDPSYHHIRTMLLTADTEPDLAKVKSTLMASTKAQVSVKPEPSDSVAMAARHRSPPSAPVQGAVQLGAGMVDSKGYRWCDTSAEGVCHRCGRPGHIAARCMYSMPDHVKEAIRSSVTQASMAHVPPSLPLSIYGRPPSPPGSRRSPSPFGPYASASTAFALSASSAGIISQVTPSSGDAQYVGVEIDPASLPPLSI